MENKKRTERKAKSIAIARTKLAALERQKKKLESLEKRRNKLKLKAAREMSKSQTQNVLERRRNDTKTNDELKTDSVAKVESPILNRAPLQVLNQLLSPGPSRPVPSLPEQPEEGRIDEEVYAKSDIEIENGDTNIQQYVESPILNRAPLQVLNQLPLPGSNRPVPSLPDQPDEGRMEQEVCTKLDVEMENADTNSRQHVISPILNLGPLQKLSQVLSGPNSTVPSSLDQPEDQDQVDRIIQEAFNKSGIEMENGETNIQHHDNDSDYDSDITLCYSTDDLPSLPEWNSGYSSFHTDQADDESDATQHYNNFNHNSNDSYSSLSKIDEDDENGTSKREEKKLETPKNENDDSLSSNSTICYKSKMSDSDSSDIDLKCPWLFRDMEVESSDDDCGNEDLDNALKALLGGPSKSQPANGGSSKDGRKRKAPDRPPKPAKRRRRYGSEEMFSDGSENSYDDLGMLNEISKVMTGSSRDNNKTNKVKIPNALEEEEEYGVAELYDDYMPVKLKIGCPHPDPVVETASLASVEPVDVKYSLSLPQDTIEKGKLSALQLEAVVYSAQAHDHRLPRGERPGFLVGDGAGVGKGRTVAGVIYENWLRGRKRAIWISVSNDLKLDAERDLNDIGASEIKVHLLKDYKYVRLSSLECVSRGVMFMTYTALSSRGRVGADGAFTSRVDQLIDWCGDNFDGVIVLDECHRAKNLCPPGGKGKPTKTGLNVLKLQEKLPQARLVYASATGATEPKNMAYMVRLGLWGQGTAFGSFSDFIKVVEKGGVGAMEIVAMDMKLRGMYIARQLSFRGVDFRIEEVPISGPLRQAYDNSVALWVKAQQLFKKAVELYFSVEPENPMIRKTVWSQFWGAHQRFFKYLCIAVKVDRAVEIALQAVKDGKCAVIGLQSTGEARTLQQLDQQTDELEDFLSTAEGVFKNLVDTQLPGNKKQVRSAIVASQLSDIHHSLLEDLDKLSKQLPRNMLDDLIDKLGGADVVAEMTGRKGRLVRTVEDGKQLVQYESRCSGEATLDTVNILEKQQFMEGHKLLAVISEAASSGVSLQSDRRVSNQRRRVHITLELPWSADRAVQQFGRTHRSNQVNAPQYVFLISELAGERRFASVVAKRLESLGALTHGDRRATQSRDLSQFNIDNKYGKDALQAVLHAVRGGYCRVPPPASPPDFLTRARTALEHVGLLAPEEGGYALTKVLATTEPCDMKKFLNRMLGVPVELQNCLFKYFVDTLATITDEAKRQGSFDQGIVDVRGARCVRAVRVLRQHATGHAVVTLHTLLVDRGMDWNSAYRKYEACGGTFYESRTVCNGRRNILLYVDDGRPQIYRPGTGLQRAEPLSEVQRKNSIMQGRGWEFRARGLWSSNHEASRTVCSHAFFRTCTPDCKWGLRERTYHVLAGSVLAVWDKMDFQRMQVVRMRCHDDTRIVGTLIHQSCVDAIEKSLKEGAVSVEVKTY